MTIEHWRARRRIGYALPWWLWPINAVGAWLQPKPEAVVDTVPTPAPRFEDTVPVQPAMHAKPKNQE